MNEANWHKNFTRFTINARALVFHAFVSINIFTVTYLFLYLSAVRRRRCNTTNVSVTLVSLHWKSYILTRCSFQFSFYLCSLSFRGSTFSFSLEHSSILLRNFISDEVRNRFSLLLMSASTYIQYHCESQSIDCMIILLTSSLVLWPRTQLDVY